jgi:hypothetical protein
LENFEEIAEQSGMDADDFKDKLDALKPLFDELSDVIESRVSNRVKLLTEVYGMHADEADALARSMKELDFNSFMANQFNRLAQDATSGFGFARLSDATSGNMQQLLAEQVALEAALRDEFGGDLDLAARSEGGMRLIEQLFNNLFAQSMALDPTQTGAGAEITAITNLERIFGPSGFLGELGENFETFLRQDSNIESLLGEGNNTLLQIANKLDTAFGGSAEQQVRQMLGEEFMGNARPMATKAGYDQFVNERIGVAMSALFSTNNPITVTGLISPEALDYIKDVVAIESARLQDNIAQQINDSADQVGVNVNRTGVTIQGFQFDPASNKADADKLAEAEGRSS